MILLNGLLLSGFVFFTLNAACEEFEAWWRRRSRG